MYVFQSLIIISMIQLSLVYYAFKQFPFIYNQSYPNIYYKKLYPSPNQCLNYVNFNP